MDFSACASKGLALNTGDETVLLAVKVSRCFAVGKSTKGGEPLQEEGEFYTGTA